ncbi:hypothetical protein ATW55_01650 [Ferroacidibacillus organovorans]|uniref:Uncharacterized protein n=1 Tax=Ferroacidibacillus organovorans TaxID=1765683 RepID=A0A101XRC3_9BACL|nr:hypothetical protein ATW55_01650 [Ferroacidibacillus organovorans]
MIGRQVSVATLPFDPWWFVRRLHGENERRTFEHSGLIASRCAHNRLHERLLDKFYVTDSFSCYDLTIYL